VAEVLELSLDGPSAPATGERRLVRRGIAFRTADVRGGPAT